MREIRYDIVIAGGSLEGTASAWSAAQQGANVCLIEASSSLGGRYSAQRANLTEESLALVTAGDLRAYQVFREAVRSYYSNADSFFSSGGAQPTSPAGLTMVPPVAHEILSLLLATLPNIHIRVHTKITHVETDGDSIMSVTVVDPIETTRCVASYFLDATDFGDLPPDVRQKGSNSASGTTEATSFSQGGDRDLPEPSSRCWRGTSVLPEQHTPWQHGVGRRIRKDHGEDSSD